MSLLISVLVSFSSLKYKIELSCGVSLMTVSTIIYYGHGDWNEALSSILVVLYMVQSLIKKQWVSLLTLGISYCLVMVMVMIRKRKGREGKEGEGEGGGWSVNWVLNTQTILICGPLFIHEEKYVSVLFVILMNIHFKMVSLLLPRFLLSYLYFPAQIYYYFFWYSAMSQMQMGLWFCLGLFFMNINYIIVNSGIFTFLKKTPKLPEDFFEMVFLFKWQSQDNIADLISLSMATTQTICLWFFGLRRSRTMALYEICMNFLLMFIARMVSIAICKALLQNFAHIMTEKIEIWSSLDQEQDESVTVKSALEILGIEDSMIPEYLEEMNATSHTLMTSDLMKQETQINRNFRTRVVYFQITTLWALFACSTQYQSHLSLLKPSFI